MADTTILERCITLGPWGPLLGKEWIYIPEGFIKKIRISHERVIDCIEFQSDCINGATQKSSFGGQSGKRTDTICIDYPDEYLTSISGTIGNRKYGPSVTSLCFHTNQNRYGPYGCDEGTTGRFSYDGKGGVIVGFHGRVYGYISAIGFYVMPKSLAMDWISTSNEKSGSEICCRMPRSVIPGHVGPWGSSGGKPWDDGVFYSIKQIRIQLGEPLKVIFGIQFKYVQKNSEFLLSRFHGRTDGDISEVEINLDGMQEYFTGISGLYGPVNGYDGLEGITSITFNTNKGNKHGPYGQKSEGRRVSFSSAICSGKVVGFHGRIGDFLTAIGVHMEYF